MSTLYFKFVTFMDYFCGSVLGETLGVVGDGQPCLVHPLGSQQRHQHLPATGVLLTDPPQETCTNLTSSEQQRVKRDARTWTRSQVNALG